MEEIKDDVVEQTTAENVGTETTEQMQEVVEERKSLKDILAENPEYQEEFNGMMKGRISRAEKAVRREYEEKYNPLDNTLNAALGTKTPEEATTKLQEYYKEQGVEIPEYRPKFNDHDLNILANSEAREIIDEGYDSIKSELDRLTDKGTERMTTREKLVYKELAEAEKSERESRELKSIGVKEFSPEFKEFANKLEGSKMSMKEKYELFEKLNPKEEIEPIGSMKGTVTKDKYKDYYTPEEARKFTSKQLDDPELMKILDNSMKKWYDDKASK